VTAKGNPAASVRARLLNRAKADKAEFQLVLTRFALERLLYRLSKSPYRDQFLLKGALLFDLWFDEPHRPTRDADFLGFGAADIPRIETIFRDICEIAAAEDGMVFDPASVKGQEIRKEANYTGIRITLLATLDGAECPVQADIGFGDAVTPGPEDTDYPAYLDDLPVPYLRVYPKYSAIAEKFEAIVSLGMGNSRMKDFFDLWVLTQNSELELKILRAAFEATFDRRGTAIPTSTPVGLSDEFASDRIKQTQWRAFITKNRLEAPPLSEVVTLLSHFFSRITSNG
jgi:predicted nucleotidyltransferase component of viral defense system